MKKVFSSIALSLLLASCGTKVDFTTDATVHSADIGVLRQQDYVVIGFKPDAYFEYRGPVNYVPVGKGLRGSEPSFTFGSALVQPRSEARMCTE